MATVWENISFGLPYVLFVLCLFVILVISHFGFGAGLVMVASVPGHSVSFACCDKFHFITMFMSVNEIKYQENPFKSDFLM